VKYQLYAALNELTCVKVEPVFELRYTFDDADAIIYSPFEEIAFPPLQFESVDAIVVHVLPLFVLKNMPGFFGARIVLPFEEI